MVMDGNGYMLVLAVGRHSFNGKLKEKLQAPSDETPLQIKLAQLADDIGHIGTISAGCTLAAMLLHYIYDCFQTDDFMEAFFSIETINEIV